MQMRSGPRCPARAPQPSRASTLHNARSGTPGGTSGGAADETWAHCGCTSSGRPRWNDGLPPGTVVVFD